MTIGKVVQVLAAFPIPPGKARFGAATCLSTVAIVALLQIHSFPGVIAAAISGALLVLAMDVSRKRTSEAG